MVGNTRDTQETGAELTFTKKAAKSGKGYLVWLPKDVTDFLDIDEESTVEIRIRKLKKGVSR